MTELSWDDIKKRREPATRTVPVCLDDSVLDEIERLNGELSFARLEDSRHKGDLQWQSKALPIAKRIVELEAERDRYAADFVFHEIPDPEWESLLRAHGPTDAQRKEGIRDFNPETYPAAVIAACLVSPKMTEDDALELTRTWSTSEVRRLFRAAVDVNTKGRDVPKASELASEVIKEFGGASEQPSDLASPPPSSTDG